MNRVGLLTRLWRWLFDGVLSPSECFTQLCIGKRDPRCGGGNCTTHCNALCHARCSSLSVVPGNLTALNGMGHDSHCMTVGTWHIYMCRSCGFRLVVSINADVMSRKDAHDLMVDLETCDAAKVREVMES